MDPVDSYEHAGLTVEIIPDDTPEHTNPRTDCDNASTMFFRARDYSLGDEQGDRYHDDYYPTLRHYADHLVKERDVPVLLFLRFVDQSYAGTCYVVEDPDDANGLIYQTRETVREEWGNCGAEAKEKAYNLMRAEVSVYASYLEGHVYGFEIKDADGEHLDSCWGFIGDPDEEDENYIHAEAKAAAECCAKAIEREESERAEWAARDVVTV